MLPDLQRADRIGEFWSYPESRTFDELLIDCGEDLTLRATITHCMGASPRGITGRLIRPSSTKRKGTRHVTRPRPILRHLARRFRYR